MFNLVNVGQSQILFHLEFRLEGRNRRGRAYGRSVQLVCNPHFLRPPPDPSYRSCSARLSGPTRSFEPTKLVSRASFVRAHAENLIDFYLIPISANLSRYNGEGRLDRSRVGMRDLFVFKNSLCRSVSDKTCHSRTYLFFPSTCFLPVLASDLPFIPISFLSILTM